MDARRLEIWHRRGDIDTPTGINTAIGAAVIVAATLVAARVPASAPGLRCGLVAVVTGVFALCTVDPLAAVAVVPAAWMLMNGFLVNSSGDLTWHGSSDAYRFVALAGTASAGLVAGATRRALVDLRARRQLGALPQPGMKQ